MQTANYRNRIAWVSKIVLSVLTAVLGGLFLTQILRIYLSNPTGVETDTYSREIVGQKLLEISIPAILWALFAVWTYVWVKLAGETPERYKANVPAAVTLARLTSRLPDTDDGLKTLRQKRRDRKTLLWLYVAVCVAFVAVCLTYLLDANNFPNQSLNDEILRMAAVILPFTAVALLLGCMLSQYYDRSLKADVILATNTLKQAVKRGGLVKKEAEPQGKLNAFFHGKAFLWTVRGVLATGAVALLIVGCFNGGIWDVLNKAINICTECIGLG